VSPPLKTTKAIHPILITGYKSIGFGDTSELDAISDFFKAGEPLR
jgi:hypothetical protein